MKDKITFQNPMGLSFYFFLLRTSCLVEKKHLIASSESELRTQNLVQNLRAARMKGKSMGSIINRHAKKYLLKTGKIFINF
jgi:hypothetical protein